MSTRQVNTPTSRVRFGLARTDVTPPVGIYHRLWGAARHEQATGVHRPLYADVMAFAPLDQSQPPVIRANLDFCALAEGHQVALREAMSSAADVPVERVVIDHQHTHSSGWFAPDRYSLPGGNLIPPFIEDVSRRLAGAARSAVAALRPVTIDYAVGRCDLAGNRDYWDDVMGGYACGFNPDAPADDTVVVARVTDAAGTLVATVVNYGCHPTTLAWDNSLISPDYPGAMRVAVEEATGAPCVFAQGACGDLGPRRGYVGDTSVADRNGRQLGYAALSALTSLGPPATDFTYAGPVVSGATLGSWDDRPLSAERLAETSRFSAGRYTIDLPLREPPSRDALVAELERRIAAQRAAEAAGDAQAARDAGAHAERARRWLGRLNDLPEGQTTYPLQYTVQRMGDAVWITTGGEPYNVLQVELRRRFPALTILFSPVSGDVQVAYLLPRDRYGKGLYQEEPSILGTGCLEQLLEALTERIAAT
jgi:hypothetical protein